MFLFHYVSTLKCVFCTISGQNKLEIQRFVAGRNIHYCIRGYFRSGFIFFCEFRESDLAKISTSIYVYL